MDSELTPAASVTPAGAATAGPLGGASWAAAASRGADAIASLGRWRTIRTVEESGPRTAILDADGVRHEMVQFASNDYLGLSLHPAVIAAATEATERWGAGAGASRLVVGSRPVHDALEAALADWKQQDAALLFPTGYAANLGVLGSLARLGSELGRPVAILSDELNHASIIDGARLSRTSVAVYPHNDAERAAAACASLTAEGHAVVIVTDSVFSMDGDVAPLAELAAIAAHHGALLVVDDAHAVFPGTWPKAGLDCEHLVVGTLSKTLGAAGGFIAGPSELIGWCRNTARSSIFSTAIPPGTAAAALAAVDVVTSAEGSVLVERLRGLVDRLVPGHRSAVLPVVVGGEAEALAASAALAERGLLVPAIRPPSVAEGTSRLRVALSAAHEDSMVEDLATALDDLGLRPERVTW